MSAIDSFQKKDFLTLLQSVSAVHSECRDLKTLAKVMTRCAAAVCQAEGSFLLLLDEVSGKLNFIASNGMHSAQLSTLSLGVGEGIAGWAAKTRHSLILGKSGANSGYGGSLSGILEKTGFPAKSLIAVPIEIENEKLFGVIEVLNKIDETDFEDYDCRLLEFFAEQCAIAFTNNAEYTKLRDELRAAEGQVANADIDGGFKAMIAKSPLMQEKLEIISRLAKTDSSVLILGESGVGKELVAEQIHFLSDRKNKAFIRVNCAVLNDELAESELFGHVKGAFTGALAERKGRFELAHNGTIFLDEISDMPLSLQATLLRVLQEKTFEKVGSDSAITVDVRILAATNKDIEKLVNEGAFRKDLYYRLNVLPIYVPPLRQRHEDIPELALHFLKKFSGDLKKHFTGFSDEAMQELISYNWPGNIRELENCIERACVIAKENCDATSGNLIEKQDLLISKVNQYNEGKQASERDLHTAISTFKKHYVCTVLEAHNWNQTEAAKAMRIQRTYLSRLLREMDIRIKDIR